MSSNELNVSNERLQESGNAVGEDINIKNKGKSKPVRPKKLIFAILFVLIGIIVIGTPLYYFLYHKPLQKYNLAFEYIENNMHYDAYQLFKELGGFKDSEDQLNHFQYACVKVTNPEDERDYTVYTYDKGFLVKKVQHYYNTPFLRFDGGNETVTTTFHYDENRNLVKELQKGTDGSESLCLYNYNKKGQLVSGEVREADEKVSFTCNRKGRISSTHTINDNDEYTEKAYYDKKDFVTKVETDSLFDGKTVSEYNYKYNEDGALTVVSVGVGHNYMYEYDDNGRIIKENYNNTINTFDYDDKGNIIRKTYLYRDYSSSEEFEYDFIYLNYNDGRHPFYTLPWPDSFPHDYR